MRLSLESFLHRQWQQRGWWSWLMRPLSALYGSIARRRRQQESAQAVKLAVPVVVAGNLFVGGTGKTPLVIAIVRHLQAQGMRPGVISRGYGAQASSVSEVRESTPVTQSGDEPWLIHWHTGVPVFVGRQRTQAAQALLQAYPETDVLIADDGLQHYRLSRDIELVLFDQRGAGNGLLLPAGPLRELPDRRRDFTILNAPLSVAVQQVPGLADAQNLVRMQLQTADCWQLSDPAQQRALSSFAAETVTAAAGIGHPERFFQTLRSAGIQPQTMPFADHYQFSATDFQSCDSQTILITEKDAVKCLQIPALKNDRRIWVVPVEAQLTPSFLAGLTQMISEKQRGSPSA